MRLIHILKAAAIVLNTIVFGPLVVSAGALDQDGKLGYRVARLWMRVILWISGVRVRVVGRENVDPSRSYVFMSNHRSNADIIAIAAALDDFQLRWVAKKELLRVPIFGWGLKALKNVIIDRSNRAEAVRTYALAGERIRRGISVMMFPEGTRGEGPALLPFKKGGFVLALQTGTPIVPLAVLGTEQVLPRRGWRVEVGDVEVRIGRPVPIEGVSIDERDQVVSRVRSEIEALIAAPPTVEPVPATPLVEKA